MREGGEEGCTCSGEEVAIGDAGLLFSAALLLASSASLGQYLTRAMQGLIDEASSMLSLSLSVSAMASSVPLVGMKRKTA